MYWLTVVFSMLAICLGLLWKPDSAPGRLCRLEVRTIPTSAQVSLNDSQAGLSDSVFEAPAGRVEVIVRKTGYREARTSLDLTSSKVPLVTLELQPATTNVKLKLKNSKDADLWLGPGVPKKMEARSELSLEPGLYEIWASRKDGSTTERRTFKVTGDKPTEIALNWNEEPEPVAVAAPAPRPRPRPAPVYRAPVYRAPRYTPPPAAYTPPPRPYYPPPRRTYIPPPVYRPVPAPVWTPIAPAPAPPPVDSGPEPLFTPVP